MVPTSFAQVLALLESDALHVGAVGVFWGLAKRVRLPDVSAPVLSLPATLHLEGVLESIAYAQLLAGPGLQQAAQQTHAALAWSRQPPHNGRQRAAVSSFAIPELALHWQEGHSEPGARQLAVEFASVLLEEFPDPVAEVLRIFNTDLTTLVNQLAEADYLQAGTTLPSGS